MQESKGMKITVLAKRINKTSSNIYDIFERESIDTALLMKIGNALEHDFFQYYKSFPANGNEVNERHVEYRKPETDKPTISIVINNVNEKQVKTIFKQFNELIK